MGGDDSQKLLPWRGIHSSPGRKPPAQLRINNVTETAGWNLALPPPSLAGLAVASATGRLGHFWKAPSGQFWRAPKEICTQHQGVLPGAHDLLRRGVVADSDSKLRFALSQRAQSSRFGEPTHQPRTWPQGNAGEVKRRQRLGGMLNYYYRAAA